PLVHALKHLHGRLDAGHQGVDALACGGHRFGGAFRLLAHIRDGLAEPDHLGPSLIEVGGDTEGYIEVGHWYTPAGKSGDTDMALVECPDCGREISDSAASCIGCGRPMHSMADGAVVVEQTAKKYKGWMAASFLGAIGFIVLAIVVAMLGHKPVVPVALAAACVASYLAAVIAAWWNHG
ncbi:MAG: hypothetical protein WBW32_05930, partial [Luteibacter sp.]